MNWFRDLKVIGKLFFGFGLVLLVEIIVSSISIVNVGNISSSVLKNKINSDLMNELKLREVNHLDWVAVLNTGIIQGRAEAITLETDPHKCKFGQWYYSQDRKKAETEFPELSGHLLKIEEPHNKLHESAVTIKANLAAGAEGKVRAINIFETETRDSLKKVRELLNASDSIIRAGITSTENRVFSTVNTTRNMILIFSGLAIVISMGISLVIGHSISVPIRNIVGFSRRLAEGDFTERVDLDRKDELGLLAGSLNESTDNLEKLISEIMTASQNLVQAVMQIAAGNQNLSQRTSEQASSLEEIASTIEEATAAIRQNADNSNDANRLARETTKLAEDGNLVLVDAVTSINEIKKSSTRIEEIISLINEIAFQTNLLALNAAVEAARAGEQGRGFAVVAGEVRNLAQRSANAAKEIGILIQDSTEKITAGTEMSHRSGDALKEIVGSMKSVASLISEIAVAGQEQKQGIDQINIAITEMDTMTQQNAALVEETASASEEMAAQAKDLQAMMERFKIR